MVKHIPPCDVCGLYSHNCLCPICPTCGESGRIHCYEDHALCEDMSASAIMAAFALVNPTRKTMANVVNDWYEDLFGSIIIGPNSTGADFTIAIDRIVRAGKPVSQMIDSIYDIGTP